MKSPPLSREKVEESEIQLTFNGSVDVLHSVRV